jgi:transcriptional regulator with XRE-family HTH domain
MKPWNSREISQRTCHIIRDERIARNLTQIEMAKTLGISQSALSKIENLAMMPTLIPWLRFCSTFNLPSDLPINEKNFKGLEPGLSQSARNCI